MDFILDSELITLISAFCVGLCVLFTILAAVNVFNDISVRYKERFIREASTELDDVLWELPPERVLDLSLLSAAVVAGIVAAAQLLTAEPSVVLETGETIGGFSWTTFGFFTIVGAIVGFPIPRFYLRMRRRQRLEKFNEQLVDGLNSISSALRAGFSINQAMESLADEKTKPISDEFTILVREMRLGVSLEEALQKMNARLGSEDFELVAAAIITARQTGGELTVVLDRLSAMIRERLRIHGRIRALTAQGRLQAYIIGGMPYLLLIAMTFVAKDMTASFYSSGAGIGVLCGVTVLVLCGFFAIKKITTIDV